MTSRFYTIV